MKLTNPTDDELNAAFAEKVAGWKRVVTHEISFFDTNGISCGKMAVPSLIEAFERNGLILREPPRFTQSADAVLPWLEKWPLWSADKTASGEIRVRVSMDAYTVYFEAFDKAFPRAVVLALLPAHGVEVEFTK